MNSTVQLISFFVSFVYGIFFYLTSVFNKFIISNRKFLFKFLITLIFVVDIVILYIYIMFKINYGIIHPYFLLVLFLGYLFMFFFYPKIKIICKIYVKKLKH